VLWIFSFTFAGSIQITKPQGGETYNCGEAMRIEWQSTGCGDRVRIMLRAGVQTYVLVNRTTNQEGGNRANPMIPTIVPPGIYRVSMETTTGTSCEAQSAQFTVRCDVETQPQPQGSIRVTSPNGGETWKSDSNIAYEVRWTSSGLSGNVTVKLKKGGTTVKSWSTPNTGSSYWLCAGVAEGTDYKIKVQSNDGSVSDESDRYFTIQGPGISERPPLVPWIQVGAPNGGETWTFGLLSSTATVSWTSGNFAGDVKVILKKGGSAVRTQTAANTGSVSFSYSGVSPGNDYKIRVESSDGSVSDESDGNFTIARPTLEPKEPLQRPPVINWFRINNGAETTDEGRVTLSHQVSQIASSPTEYRVCYVKPSGEVWTGWYAYVNAPTFQLDQECQEHTLALQVRNNIGESGSIQDSIKYIFAKTHTLKAATAWEDYAAPNGWGLDNTRSDFGSECVILLMRQTGEIKFVSQRMGGPIGSKCEWEIFTGKQLKEGWTFWGYNYHGRKEKDCGYEVLQEPALGGRDLKLKVRVWTNPQLSPPDDVFVLENMILSGPCDQDVSEAFK
jgi:hypothetical protein